MLFLWWKWKPYSNKGPKQYKIVHYFACEKFIEMTTSGRFQLLRHKKYCIQFLFPGADQDKGKHSDGKCQTDFIWKHQSQRKYPIKKHVLICWSNAENQQLLTHHETNFITSIFKRLEDYIPHQSANYKEHL